MPRRDSRKYIYDISDCCQFLLDFTQNKTVEDYIHDRAFRSALERELQIIGEAMLQLDHLAPDITEQIPDSRNIIGFRNILVHGYDSLNPATVWNVIETKLDILYRQVQSLL